MKKNVLLLFFIIFQLIAPLPVFAQSNEGDKGDIGDKVESVSQGSIKIKGSETFSHALASTPDIDPLKGKFSDLSSVISTLLPYILTGAGLILLGMLIVGGFEIMTAGTDAKKADAGKTRLTSAIIGFVIIFAAYWIAQILEIITGVSILK